jgi:hypothetical protein
MRDLKEMEVHRRLRGVGKSKPGDLSGRFDIHLQHNLHSVNRVAVCMVRQEQGWQHLQISIKERRNRRLSERAPSPAETYRLLPLFFLPSERPAQFHSMNGRFDRPAHFYLSERVNECVRHLPAF